MKISLSSLLFSQVPWQQTPNGKYGLTQHRGCCWSYFLLIEITINDNEIDNDNDNDLFVHVFTIRKYNQTISHKFYPLLAVITTSLTTQPADYKNLQDKSSKCRGSLSRGHTQQQQ